MNELWWLYVLNNVKMVQSYYGVHGGATTQYPVYGSGPALAAGGMMSDGVVFYLYL